MADEGNTKIDHIISNFRLNRFLLLVYIFCSFRWNFVHIITQPRFYKENKTKYLTFYQYLVDRPIFRTCEFTTKNDVKRFSSNQVLKFVFCDSGCQVTKSSINHAKVLVFVSIKD